MSWLIFIKYCPLVVGFLYFLSAYYFFTQKNWAWTMVWFSYAVSCIGLYLASAQAVE